MQIAQRAIVRRPLGGERPEPDVLVVDVRHGRRMLHRARRRGAHGRICDHSHEHSSHAS